VLADAIHMMKLRHQGFDVLERPLLTETNFAKTTVTGKVGGSEI
jgi:hypothetical protein